MGKTLPSTKAVSAVNYGRIKRDLMLRDTDNDLKRFTERTIPLKTNHKREKHASRWDDDGDN